MAPMNADFAFHICVHQRHLRILLSNELLPIDLELSPLRAGKTCDKTDE